MKNNITKINFMNSLLIQANKKTLTKSQTTFNRLIKKIEKIQSDIKKTEAILNQGLSYYHSNVFPVEEKMLEKLSECIPIFYSYYKHPRSQLSKNERGILKELIQSLLRRLADYVMPQEINAEITEIIRDIEGVDLKKMIDSGLESLKKDISSYVEQQGLKIDLSSLNATDSQEELMAKFQKAVFEASENKKTEEINVIGDVKEKVKKKSKQQLKKEQREREVEEIQQRGLSKIYKQLAKALHPDLELDPLVKAKKEALMKKLTVAYENKDLHTLLSLEITWMNHAASNESENRIQEVEEQLNVYNVLLKDQVKALQEELDYLAKHPRYFDMQHILNGCDQSSILAMLEDEERQLSRDFERYSLTIVDLKEGSNFKEIKQILQEFSSELDIFEVMHMMEELMHQFR